MNVQAKWTSLMKATKKLGHVLRDNREGPERPSSSIVYVVSQEDVTFDSLHESITKPMVGLWTVAHPDHPARISTSSSVNSDASFLGSLS